MNPNPYASPAQSHAHAEGIATPPASPPDRAVPLRMAGGFLIASAVLNFLSLFALADSAQNIGSVLISSAITAFVGASLVSGSERHLTWAMLRAALGTVWFAFRSVAEDNWPDGLLQICLGASVLLLLFGYPGKARVSVAVVLFCIYAVLTTIALFLVAILGPHGS